MHPITPFVTEKIWLTMPHDGKSIVTAAYPTVHEDQLDADAERQMDALIGLIKAVRNIRTEVNAPMSSAVDVLVKTTDKQVESILTANANYITAFCHAKELTIGSDVQAPQLAVTKAISGGEVSLPLAELINLDDEIARLKKDADKLEAEVSRAQKKLGNERFVANAPAEVVDKERTKLADYQEKLTATKARIAELSAAK